MGKADIRIIVYKGEAKVSPAPELGLGDRALSGPPKPKPHLMRIMYTRANLRVRLFSFVISALINSSTLQTVENHLFLRNGEEGSSVEPL